MGRYDTSFDTANAPYSIADNPTVCLFVRLGLRLVGAGCLCELSQLTAVTAFRLALRPPFSLPMIAGPVLRWRRVAQDALVCALIILIIVLFATTHDSPSSPVETPPQSRLFKRDSGGASTGMLVYYQL